MRSFQELTGVGTAPLRPAQIFNTFLSSRAKRRNCTLLHIDRATFSSSAMQKSLAGRHTACQYFQPARRPCRSVHPSRVYRQMLITPCRSLEDEQRDPPPTQSKEERSASASPVEQGQGHSFYPGHVTRSSDVESGYAWFHWLLGN